MSLACLLPAQAQFWDWGNRPQRQQQQYNNNWFGGGGGWFGNDRRYEASARNARRRSIIRARPRPRRRNPKPPPRSWSWATPTPIGWPTGSKTPSSEKPEIGVVRKHRTDSGLIRYDARRDIEWPQVAREIIAAEKPKFIVMMIGNNDRQTIREKAPRRRRRPARRTGTEGRRATAGPAERARGGDHAAGAAGRPRAAAARATRGRRNSPPT